MATAVMAVALSACPPVHAADPVVRSIWKAHKRGSIDAATSIRYQSTWRQSGRVARSLKRRKYERRAAEINASRSIALTMARRRNLNAQRLPGVLASVRATTYVMRKRPFPRYEERVRVPGDPLVFAYFTGRGVQFHPLATFAMGNTLYSTRQDEQLRLLAERLLEVGVRRGNAFTTWEYSFPYGGGRAPWISAMSQAVGVQVMARAWERHQDQRFLDAARAGVPAFAVDASNGGVATMQGAGRWYLLYAFRSRQRVLNGHLQALLGLNEYHRITQDPEAELRVQEGLAGLQPLLARFDTGAWSRYDLRSEANLNYHDLMTTQLTRLGRRRALPELTAMADRFRTYRVTPPAIIVPPHNPHPIWPVKDGFRDRVRLRFFIDKRARAEVQILNVDGKVIRTLPASGGRGWRTRYWNGRKSNGQIVRPGAFTVRFVARDLVGNKRTGELGERLLVVEDKRKPKRPRRR